MPKESPYSIGVGTPVKICCSPVSRHSFRSISAKIAVGEVRVHALDKHILNSPLLTICPPVVVYCKISISKPREPVGTSGYQKFAITQSNSFVNCICISQKLSRSRGVPFASKN